MFYICSSGFVTNRKDGSSKISDGSRVKPKRVQVLPVASETQAYNHYEKGWLSQIKSKFLPVSEKRKAKPLSRAQKIDMASRILFPFLYVVYNTVYWYVYLNGVEILAWDVCITFLSLFTCITATSESTRSSTGQTKLIRSKEVSTRPELRPLFYLLFHIMHMTKRDYF